MSYPSTPPAGQTHSGKAAPGNPPAGISWLQVVLLNFVWFCEVYSALLLGVGLTFVARRFTADPRLIALVSTIGLLFKGTIGPFVNYACDRIWTPWGRRRPFVVTAYCLSAAGLFVIPLTGSLTLLGLAVAGHAFVLSFASPMEPLYMELVPGPQQGRSQAIRTAMIDASVLFFFQVSLAQFDVRYPSFPGWLAPGGLSGIHLAFWTGSALFLVLAVYLALHAREQVRPGGPEGFTRNPPMRELLRSFPRDVFADGHWWPIYGLYLAPSLITGVWGSMQSLMLVEQFGYDMTRMARIGLPVTLAGMVVLAPLMGYGADRGHRHPRWHWLAAALLLGGIGWMALSSIRPKPDELPPLGVALAYCLPLGLAVACGLMSVIGTLEKYSGGIGRRACFVIVSFSGQAGIAFTAWTWTQFHGGPHPVMPVGLWLSFLTLTKTFSLASTVSLLPLVFNRISPEKFGTVSSGFGLLSAVLTYLLANVGGFWVHQWTRWQASPTSQYHSLWLLETAAAIGALVLVVRCMRSPLAPENPRKTAASSTP
jgi:hypothetical protein